MYYLTNSDLLLNLAHFATYGISIHEGQHEVRAHYATPPPEKQNAKQRPWEVLYRGTEQSCKTFLSRFATSIKARTYRKVAAESRVRQFATACHAWMAKKLRRGTTSPFPPLKKLKEVTEIFKGYWRRTDCILLDIAYDLVKGIAANLIAANLIASKM